MADFLVLLIKLTGNSITLLIIARAIMSFFPVDRDHSVVKLIYDLTEPILAPIRHLLPQTGMLDFSPMVVILVVILLEPVLETIVRSLF
ncbi:MAG TPA: YggT family protein [Anaerolineales bacterium]|nr:YggT family protein [Anaerolineales bacterium]